MPLSERICKVCNSGVVEDEIHFLFKCPNYSHDRLIMFSKASENSQIFLEMDSLDKFVYLMANHERAVISFLTKAVYKRRHSLYNVSDTDQ